MKATIKYAILLLALVLTLTVSGVSAVWTYLTAPEPLEQAIPMQLSGFKYADIYITKIEAVGSDGTMTKTDHTTVEAALTGASSFLITFYNDSSVTYYYNEAQTLSGSAAYTVEGIAQKDAVESKTYKTVTVSFAGGGSAEVHFSFVVDKESIGEVVANTAVDRFREILNTSVDYETLTGAMDDRTGWNTSSSVTYIGNVAGSDTGDSTVINGLFGDGFMSMDLDGDGRTEPITMMIKRENLDGDDTTGDEYSYTYWNRTYTVKGAEMTLYITAQDLTNVDQGDSVVVYAAAFTRLAGESEWVVLVPLTKGTATANNYSSGTWGSANSFDTDTWEADSGHTLEELISAQAS